MKQGSQQIISLTQFVLCSFLLLRNRNRTKHNKFRKYKIKSKKKNFKCLWIIKLSNEQKHKKVHFKDWNSKGNFVYLLSKKNISLNSTNPNVFMRRSFIIFWKSNEETRESGFLTTQRDLFSLVYCVVCCEPSSAVVYFYLNSSDIFLLSIYVLKKKNHTKHTKKWEENSKKKEFKIKSEKINEMKNSTNC